jgi:hypothetical protein
MTNFTIDTDKIVDGSYLMMNNKDLTTWNSRLTKLVNGHCMFKGCENLSKAIADRGEPYFCIPSLEDASYMFEGVNTAEIFNVNTFGANNGKDKITNAEGMFKNCKKVRFLNFTVKGIAGFWKCLNFKQMFYNAGIEADARLSVGFIELNASGNPIDLTEMFAAEVISTPSSWPILPDILLDIAEAANIANLTNLVDGRRISDDTLLFEYISYWNPDRVSANSLNYLGRVFTDTANLEEGKIITCMDNLISEGWNRFTKGNSPIPVTEEEQKWCQEDGYDYIDYYYTHPNDAKIILRVFFKI